MNSLKIALVDLDGKTVPDWVLEKLVHAGIDLVIGDSKTREDLVRYAADAEVVWLFGGSKILQGNLDVVPRCWAIIRTGSGTDNVPVEEATRRGIVVANTPAAFSDSVSDHVVALLLAAVRRIVPMDAAVRRGEWNKPGPFPTALEPVNTVQGRTLGLVGFGHIAREVARKLSGYAMTVLVYDPFLDANAIKSHGAVPASLEALLSQADYVSLHCPLTPQTRHLIGEAQLRSMKPTAVLINTSRGPVIDERALLTALTQSWIAAAALDVVEAEPPNPNNPLFKLENVVVTPHIAGLSAEGAEVRWRTSVETVLRLAERRWPPSPVNHNVQPKQPLTP